MMKFLQNIIVLAMFSGVLFAEPIEQTITMGKDYKNDIWYSLKEGVVHEADKDNWDIAFQTGQRAAVLINGQKGLRAWMVPGSNEDSFNKPVDTTGMESSWEWTINSEVSWHIGAFNMNKDGYETGGDFGWGYYDLSTHYIVGNKLFVLRLGKGIYKKFMIEVLAAGEYTIRYANLNGTDEGIAVIKKRDYDGQNFAYFNLNNNTALSREPQTNDWDLVFGRYESLIPFGQGQFMAYPVLGVRQNFGIKTARLKGVNPIQAEPPVIGSEKYSTKISSVGSDWKTFNQSEGKFVLANDLVFFVYREDALAPEITVYKIVFTEFTGAEAGITKFNQTPYVLSGIEDFPGLSYGIFPNVIGNNESINFVMAYENSIDNINIRILSVDGREVINKSMVSGAGLNAFDLGNLNAPSGMYFVILTIGNKVYFDKLIVR